jgi:hypothetical protein
MAELDFKHHVSEIPRGERLPDPIQRKEQVQISHIPDFQTPLENYGSATNWMSSVGSKVAASASNSIASKLGGDLGKNPQGELTPSITDFDKQLSQSYDTQAQATLGIEAQKLITKSNLELAEQPRLNQEMISKAQKNTLVGLDRIFSLAPSSIRPQMEHSYSSLMIHQNEQLVNRMVNEQKEDRKNNTILSNNLNAETAHALASAGKFDEAEKIIRSTESINNSAVAGNIGFTLQQGKVGTDTVRQSAIAGRLQYEYEQAVKSGKGDEYLKNLANRPSWISDADYPNATQSLKSYVSNQQALRSNYEDLTMTEFKTRMAVNIGSITGTELQSALDKLSPTNAAKLNLEYVNAYKTYLKDTSDQNILSQNWEDPTAQANATEKIKNNTFNGKVQYYKKANPNMSIEDAESAVAASAGGVIPVFTDTLKNKLWSGDPSAMIAASRQIDKLQSEGNGHALKGLNEQDLAIASDITHNFNPSDPDSAARMITQNKLNQDATFRKESEATFAHNIYNNTIKNNTTTDDYILSKFNMNGGLLHPSSGFDSPWSKSNYASDILSNYRTNFINTGRDDDRAVTMTKQYIANNYGRTSINGSSELTLHPIEKACGFNEGEGITVINADLLRQISEPLAAQKKAYDDKRLDHYWTVEPVMKEKFNILASHPFTKEKNIERLNFIKHTREGISTNTEKYPLRLVGNNFNWDLNVETANGPRSIFLEDPTIGIHTYTPDLKWIKAHSHG